jgi:hypothetical protein
MRKKQSFLRGLSLVGALGLAFCNNSMDPTNMDPGNQMPQQVIGPDYGLNHDDILNNIGDIFTDGRQVPPALGQTLHSCGKVRFNVLTNILKTRGINVTNNAANSAGALLAKSQPVWGVANFPARTAETIRDTTSSLVGLHDILIAAAEEWVTTANPDGAFTAAMSPACGTAKLFNNNTCDKDGFACLMGAPPVQRQLDVCNSMINDVTAGVTDIPTKRRLAIASMVGTVAMCD